MIMPSRTWASPSRRAGSAVDPDFLKSQKALAGTSYGQGQMQATALQMALVAAGVAHGGAVPAPYIVQKVVNPANNATVLAATPRDLGRAISPTSAATLQQMMIVSVEKGYANPAAHQRGDRRRQDRDRRNGPWHQSCLVHRLCRAGPGPSALCHRRGARRGRRGQPRRRPAGEAGFAGGVTEVSNQKSEISRHEAGIEPIAPGSRGSDF